jgi:hypothetical protein
MGTSSTPSPASLAPPAWAIDDSSLYVNLGSVGVAKGHFVSAIDRIDLAGLRKVGALHMPVDTSRGDMALAGGRLWVSAGACTGSALDRVVSVDPETGTMQTYPPDLFAHGCAHFATSRSVPDVLIVTSSDLGVYRVTDGHPVQVVRGLINGMTSFHVAIADSGTQLLVPYISGHMATYSLDSLQLVDWSLPGPMQPVAVIVAAGRVFTAESRLSGHRDLWEYRHEAAQHPVWVDVDEATNDPGPWPATQIEGIAGAGMTSPIVFFVTGNQEEPDAADTWFYVWRPSPTN